MPSFKRDMMPGWHGKGNEASTSKAQKKHTDSEEDLVGETVGIDTEENHI